jgi:GntR family transcriptional regulator
MQFRLDQRSGVPPYLQLVQQVTHALHMGILDVGDQLPTVKDVVSRVAINPNTVLKAYRELEYAGWVEGRPGVGTFVTRRPPGPPAGANLALTRGLERWIDKARAAGLDDESMNALLRSTLQSRPAGRAASGEDVA